jgi:hypothetical protein
VAGAGGYTRLGKLQKINGAFPTVPLAIGDDLTLEQYDQRNFGFLRVEVSKTQIVGRYFSDQFPSPTPSPTLVESFVVDLASQKVQTLLV